MARPKIVVEGRDDDLFVAFPIGLLYPRRELPIILVSGEGLAGFLSPVGGLILYPSDRLSFTDAFPSFMRSNRFEIPNPAMSTQVHAVVSRSGQWKKICFVMNVLGNEIQVELNTNKIPKSFTPSRKEWRIERCGVITQEGLIARGEIVIARKPLPENLAESQDYVLTLRRALKDTLLLQELGTVRAAEVERHGLQTGRTGYLIYTARLVEPGDEVFLATDGESPYFVFLKSGDRFDFFFVSSTHAEE